MVRHPDCTYLLPFRRTAFCPEEASELGNYLKEIGRSGCEIMIVDGSSPEVFRENDAAWTGLCRHVPVDRSFAYLNDKVNAVHTGLAAASGTKIILADDDIRYTESSLAVIVARLDNYEVVRPQNYLSPLPWWAKMEAARMLINRATLPLADYPGTCAFRKSAMDEAGHYDGDVLFDNEEILRHFARHEMKIDYAHDLFVKKRAPRLSKWFEQRPRQAYEDFGLRVKSGLFVSLIPLAAAMAILSERALATSAALTALGSMVLALIGRIKGEARHFFPLHVCLFAPAWIFERAFSSYWALYWYVTRGGFPFGENLLSKGIGRDWGEGGRLAAQNLRERQNGIAAVGSGTNSLNGVTPRS
jgi:hypothetical protein